MEIDASAYDVDSLNHFELNPLDYYRWLDRWTGAQRGDPPCTNRKLSAEPHERCEACLPTNGTGLDT
jgi:hypothetical protein